MSDEIDVVHQMTAFAQHNGLGPSHFVNRAIGEIERLRAALGKIADQYPCGSRETMSFVAAEALGRKRGGGADATPTVATLR